MKTDEKSRYLNNVTNATITPTLNRYYRNCLNLLQHYGDVIVINLSIFTSCGGLIG